MRNRSKRLDDLLGRIRMQGSSTLDDLARNFDVSTATIRRDIKELEDRHAVIRTIGGGILCRETSDLAAPGREAHVSYIEEKIRIAEYCTELVEEHDEIIIGPGTTAFLIGRILTGVSDRRFRIITNSLELALEASDVSNVESVVLGGEVHNHHSTGYTTHDEYFTSCRRNHKAILSADGVDIQSGITLFDQRFLSILRKMVAVSHKVIVAADSSKIGKVCSNTVAEIDVVSLLITDTNAPAEFCRALKQRGIPVVTV